MDDTPSTVREMVEAMIALQPTCTHRHTAEAKAFGQREAVAEFCTDCGATLNRVVIHPETNHVPFTGTSIPSPPVYGTIRSEMLCVKCGAVISLLPSPTIPVGSLKGRCGDCRIAYQVDPAPK